MIPKILQIIGGILVAPVGVPLSMLFDAVAKEDYAEEIAASRANWARACEAQAAEYEASGDREVERGYPAKAAWFYKKAIEWREQSENNDAPQ